MKPPCEIVVKYVLPAIRTLIVKEMMDTYGLTQVQVAEKLGITQPAVSQYIRSLRGSDKYAKLIERNKEVYKSVKALAGKIAKGELTYSQATDEFCKMCERMRAKEILCILHMESAPYLSEEECKICLE
jgi:hypothetical protein